MFDRREQILNRLEALLAPGGPVMGHVTTVRNRADLTTTKRPSIAILDGDENTKDGTHGRTSNNLCTMTPEIWISIGGREPANVNIGQDLNAFRRAVLKAVYNDATLKSLVGTNGQILYDGLVSDLARGRAMEGEIGLSISFRYPLLLNEL